MKNPFRRNRCPHINVKGIDGDVINAFGGYTLRCNGFVLICHDCDRLLEGPVSIATDRQKIINEK